MELAGIDDVPAVASKDDHFSEEGGYRPLNISACELFGSSIVA